MRCPRIALLAATALLAPATIFCETVSLPVSVVRAAMAYIGVPYAHGGASRQGMDCSGLVFRVYRETTDISLPRSVDALSGAGVLGKSPVHIADLLFFDTSEKGAPADPSHVGIYAGNDRFVHAASEGPRTGVIVSSLSEAYYHDRFLGARRVVPWRSPELRLTLTDEPSASVQANPFASRENLKLVVTSEMTGGGPVELRVLKAGEEVLMRRIAPTSGRPSVISVVADEGEWTVRVNRLYRGRELLSVSFTVEE
ncbi:MAG: C40 family peptidase [Spirochaetes bacterium]|nr:C40 family peptidase [Spirochaetota bacterium]